MATNLTAAAGIGLRPRLSAAGALFLLCLRQYVRGKRLLVLAALYLLPIGIAILARSLGEKPAELEFVLLLNMIPHAFVPLTALLYASGMIQDEIEDQTLTYLVTRSFSKRTLYLIKLLASIAVSAALMALFVAITYNVIYWAVPKPEMTEAALRCGKVIALLTLSIFAYVAIFALLSLFVRRSLVTGIAYIILMEGMLSNVDFAARRLTVVYYFRLLIARWFDAPGRLVSEWSLHLDNAPMTQTCLLALLGASAVAAVLGAHVFATSEFRLKTPEST